MQELILSSDRAILQDVLVFAICGAALIWGGGPERAVAATWLIAIELFGWVVGYWTGGDKQLLEVDVLYASSDAIAVVVFVAIALYANRNYPLWIAGMQVLAVSAHIARSLSDIISPIAYLTMVYAPGWFQLLLLASGLVRHIRRKRRHGEYRDWRLVRNPPTFKAMFGGSRVMPDWMQSKDRSWRDNLK